MAPRLVAQVLAMVALMVGCGSSASPPPPVGGSPPPVGGSPATGGASGVTGGAGGSETGTGGSVGTTGGAPADAGTSTPQDALGPIPTSGFDGGSTTPPPAGAYGGVGETPFVPVTYSATPIGPPVA